MASVTIPKVSLELELGFEGYFMCRIATDPDPTNEERGMSGYTMALPREDRLDQVIRLNADPEFLARNRREPLDQMPFEIGVKVASATIGGERWAPVADALVGAPVDLLGRDDPLAGAIFESRNNTTGSDDTMSFVIDPFDLRIASDTTTITAVDYIDPSDPDRQLWQIADPATYARRLTRCWTTGDQEVAEAIGVFDMYEYFRDRRRFLQRKIDSTGDPALRETYASRLYQLEFWGDRVISKLQTRCDWEFAINGPQQVQTTAPLGGTIDTSQPWKTAFWFGGWDGDLLVGYMRGTLSMPFTPD
jgi:hypothetical protein